MECKKDEKVEITGTQHYPDGTIGVVIGEACCKFWFYVEVDGQINSIHMSHLVWLKESR